jgi:hypothetical protein
MKIHPEEAKVFRDDRCAVGRIKTRKLIVAFCNSAKTTQNKNYSNIRYFLEGYLKYKKK